MFLSVSLLSSWFSVLQAMSMSPYPPNTGFKGGTSDKSCRKIHDKWFDENYDIHRRPPLISDGAKALNLYIAEFFCRDLTIVKPRWPFSRTLPEGQTWGSGPYKLECNPDLEDLLILKNVWVETNTESFRKEPGPHVYTDRAYCVAKNTIKHIHIAKGDERCLAFPPYPQGWKALLAFVTASESIWSEQIIVNSISFHIARQAIAYVSTLYSDRQSFLGVFEHKMTYPGRGDVYQACAYFTPLPLSDRQYVVLHVVMVDAWALY